MNLSYVCKRVQHVIAGAGMDRIALKRVRLEHAKGKRAKSQHTARKT